jgi:hypothetical protein
MNDRVLFKIRINIPDLDQFDPSAQPCQSEYEAELIFEDNRNGYIKIFFEGRESLDRKVMSCEPSYSYSLLSKFEVLEAISPKHLRRVDFREYDHRGMRSAQVDEFGRQYFTINLKGIKLTYEASEQKESEIYLNQTAFPLIELNYRYSPNFSWRNDEFQLEPLNNIKEFIHFDKIEFIPEHNFYVSNKSTEMQINIKKEPRFRIRHHNATRSEIMACVNVLCALYSFYTNQKIDWRTSRVYANGELTIESRETSEEENKFIHGIFIWDFIQNPLNLVRNVDAQLLAKNSEMVFRLIERFNYAMRASDESKFMVLYSILEELRNYYILTGLIEAKPDGTAANLNRVREEYKFIHGVDKTDAFIKDALNNITGIVDESERALFANEIPFKVSAIKLMSMTNQFERYFKYLGVDPNQYELDLKQLKSLRDTIFHGRPVKDKDFLKKAIWYAHLPRLVGELMIKFFGINDLKSIEKKRVYG